MSTKVSPQKLAVALPAVSQGNDIPLLQADEQWFRNIIPPLGDTAEVSRIASIFAEPQFSIGMMQTLNHATLKELGVVDPSQRAGILAAVTSCSDDRWTSPPGKPAVCVKLCLLALSEVNTVDQSAFARIFVDLYWIDERMIGLDPSNLPDNVWRPMPWVYNKLSDLSCEVQPLRLFNAKTGLMLGALMFEGHISISVYLSSFPFDCCSIPILVQQGELESTDMYNFVETGTNLPGGDPVWITSGLPFEEASLMDWKINGYSVTTPVRSCADGVKRSTFWGFIHSSRKSKYYMWKIVFPLFCVCLLNWSIFLYDTMELDARVNICITMFLANAALLYVVGDSLPKTDFLTKMDYLILLTLFVNILGCMETWCVYKVSKEFDDELAFQIDYWVAIGLPAFFGIVSMCIFVPPLCKRKVGDTNWPDIYIKYKGGTTKGREVFGEYHNYTHLS
jgi:hypothetical protein